MPIELTEKKRAQLERVKELAAETGVEILAHFYQRGEVKMAADFVGGSTRVAARALESRAPAVMVCGASFMADEIRQRRPSINLLTPRDDLSCPLAEKVTAAEVAQAKAKHPDALVAADMKITADLRPLVDVFISPATINDLLKREPTRPLIALPGAQLCDWAGLGERIVHRWPQAVCQVHELALAEDLIQAKEEHPEALVAVNLLCRPEVRALADFVGDSEGLFNFCAQRSREIIVVSEAGLAEYLSETFPDKIFHETEAEIFCPNMKLTTLKSMIARLEQFAGLHLK
ncbi:quinolinate synthase NadA [Deltaproteobacteria bacterium OttesenSCG-928-K17]|nr:quinolinate synthase NadA [Deltaproteobacteria bacterium OttesenSCG-928-K17]